MSPRVAWGVLALGVAVVAEILLAHHYAITNPDAFDAGQLAVLSAGIVATLVGGILVWRTWQGLPSEEEVGRAGRRWTPFIVAFVVYLVAFLVMAPIPVGDQPHFQLEALSLAYDLDRDLDNDYRERVFQVFPRGAGDRHAAQYTPGGPFVSYHSVGLPLLLAPGVVGVQAMNQINPRLRLGPWQLTMIAMASLAALLLDRVGRSAVLALGALSLMITAAFVLEPPPSVTSTPGQLVGYTPNKLWQWYADLWPQVEVSARYPDLAAICALTGALFVLNGVLYRYAGRARGPRRPARRGRSKAHARSAAPARSGP